ncbi:MAG: ANTAR domain-containing response regulator [Methylophilaceae bacterium]
MIDAAVTRFEEFKTLRNELSQAKSKLEERNMIEQAKILLMKQRNLHDDEAYAMLSNMALKRNMKLSVLAGQLVEAAKMLIL